MSHFRTDLVAHKKEVGRVMTSASSIINQRAIDHDMDKLDNDVIYDRYEEYSERWRAAPFKSKEHYAIKAEMMDAHDAHAVQRHHFYSEESSLKMTDINLFDIIENVSDWIAASGRDCHTKHEKMERVSYLINKYYGKGLDTGSLVLKIVAINTAEMLINKNY